MVTRRLSFFSGHSSTVLCLQIYSETDSPYFPQMSFCVNGNTTGTEVKDFGDLEKEKETAMSMAMTLTLTVT